MRSQKIILKKYMNKKKANKLTGFSEMLPICCLIASLSFSNQML
jgi:hypothetical protein